jgi:hypothetical protein
MPDQADVVTHPLYSLATKEKKTFCFANMDRALEETSGDESEREHLTIHKS